MRRCPNCKSLLRRAYYEEVRYDPELGYHLEAILIGWFCPKCWKFYYEHEVKNQ